MGIVVRRYIDIPYSTCISSFFGSSIPTSLFIFKMFFRSFKFKIGINSTKMVEFKKFLDVLTVHKLRFMIICTIRLSSIP